MEFNFSDEDELLKKITELSLDEPNVNLKIIYESTALKIFGETRESLFIRNIKNFINQLPPKVREEFNDVKGSTGITTFLKGVQAKGSIKEDEKLKKEKESGMIVQDESFIFSCSEMKLKGLNRYPLGLKIHGYIESDLVKREKCYSPLFNSTTAIESHQIQKFTNWMKDKLGYHFLCNEFPVWLNLCPINQIGYVEGKDYKITPKMKDGDFESVKRWLVGKLDLLVNNEKGKKTLIDFKTSFKGEVTFKDIMQMRLMALSLASMGVWIDRLVIIIIDTSKKEEKDGEILIAKSFFIGMNGLSFKDFILESLPKKEDKEKYWNFLKEKVNILDGRIQVTK